jgi:hypothetical protein
MFAALITKGQPCWTVIVTPLFNVKSPLIFMVPPIVTLSAITTFPAIVPEDVTATTLDVTLLPQLHTWAL